MSVSRRGSAQLRWIVVVVGSILAVLLIAMLLHRFAPGLVDALQASTALILTLTTGVYAYLTYRMVKVQEDPPAVRVQAEQEAVSRLEALIAGDRPGFNELRSSFPLQLGENGIEPQLNQPLKGLRAFSERLNEASLDLPPSLRLRSHAMTLELELFRGELLRLINVALKEQLLAEHEQRSISWERVRLAFEAGVEEAGAGELGEWTNLLTGRSMEKIADNLRELRHAVIDHRVRRWERR